MKRRMSLNEAIEHAFQTKLVNELEERLPGCMVFPMDPHHRQGIPDLLILYGPNWASLECKRCEDAPHRPNQDYYVNRMNQMSFSRFIFPENKEEVLNELERSLKTSR